MGLSGNIAALNRCYLARCFVYCFIDTIFHLVHFLYVIAHTTPRTEEVIFLLLMQMQYDC